MRINTLPYLAAALLGGFAAAVPDGSRVRRDASLNSKAWVDQTYGKAQGGNVCGETTGLVNLSANRQASQAADCMALLAAVQQSPELVLIAANAHWSAATADGYYPLMTRGTCTLGVRPAAFAPTYYAYFVGYQDVADILHSLVSQYQQKIGDAYRFGARGAMPCKDKIKNQPDYTMEFLFYNPEAPKQ